MYTQLKDVGGIYEYGFRKKIEKYLLDNYLKIKKQKKPFS